MNSHKLHGWYHCDCTTTNRCRIGWGARRLVGACRAPAIPGADGGCLPVQVVAQAVADGAGAGERVGDTQHMAGRIVAVVGGAGLARRVGRQQQVGVGAAVVVRRRNAIRYRGEDVAVAVVGHAHGDGGARSLHADEPAQCVMVCVVVTPLSVLVRAVVQLAGV